MRIRSIASLLPLLIVLFGCSASQRTGEPDAATQLEHTITAEVEPEHTGWILVEPQKDTYATGDAVMIEAKPRGRFVFERWGGDLDPDAPNPVEHHVIDGDLAVVAELTGGYLADRPLLSPRKNVYYEEAPRDLFFAVHSNGYALVAVEKDGQPVTHSRMPVQNREGVGQPLPGSEMVQVSRDVIEAFGPGQHRIDFVFDNGKVLSSDVTVVSAGQGKVHDMNIISFFVDHGDALLIDLPNGETLMVDTGTRENAERYVVPFLKEHLRQGENGRQRIDHIFITHWHYDHFEGLIALLEEFEIGQVRFNMDVPPNEWGDYDAYENPNDPYGFGEYGFSTDHWEEFFVGNVITGIGGDEVEIEVLNAARFDEQDERFAYYHRGYYENWFNRNNRSLSISLRYNGFVLSAGGDIYQHAQRAILNAFDPDDVKAHVYHANHHFHGGVETEYLIAVDPYLLLTSANEAVYDREAFARNVINEAVPVLEKSGSRFIENLLSFEVGHMVIRIDGSRDWSDSSTELLYETYFVNPFHHQEHRVPYLH